MKLMSAVLALTAALTMSGCAAKDEVIEHVSMTSPEKVREMRNEPKVVVEKPKRVASDLDNGTLTRTVPLYPYQISYTLFADPGDDPKSWTSTGQDVVNYSIAISGLTDRRQVNLSQLKITCDIEGQKIEAASVAGPFVMAPNFEGSFNLPGFTTKQKSALLKCDVKTDIAIQQDVTNNNYMHKSAHTTVAISLIPKNGN